MGRGLKPGSVLLQPRSANITHDYLGRLFYNLATGKVGHNLRLRGNGGRGEVGSVRATAVAKRQLAATARAEPQAWLTDKPAATPTRSETFAFLQRVGQNEWEDIVVIRIN